MNLNETKGSMPKTLEFTWIWGSNISTIFLQKSGEISTTESPISRLENN